VEQDGIATTDREFCIGAQLTFRCTLSEGSYDWIIPSFLNGREGNGKVVIGNTESVGEFVLSASGIDDTRMSTLQVTVFELLVGERTVKCRETGARSNTQVATITVLGK